MVKNFISILVTDYIQKRRGEPGLFSFEFNLLPKLISNFLPLHGPGMNYRNLVIGIKKLPSIIHNISPLQYPPEHGCKNKNKLIIKWIWNGRLESSILSIAIEKTFTLPFGASFAYKHIVLWSQPEKSSYSCVHLCTPTPCWQTLWSEAIACSFTLVPVPQLVTAHSQIRSRPILTKCYLQHLQSSLPR